MEVTAWDNGKHSPTGAGYGMKIDIKYRDLHFRKEWSSVLLTLPGKQNSIEINIDKKSFWGDTCHELISMETGIWLRSNGLAPWPKYNPPKFELVHKESNLFEVISTDF